MTTTDVLTSNLVRTVDVVNVTVKNAARETLGKIEEIILHKVSGNVCYLVLSFGGFLGVGDKLFAIPWNAIHYDEDEDCFILNVSKEKLKNAPGFDKNNWPDMADEKWGSQIYNFYETKPYWQK